MKLKRILFVILILSTVMAACTKAEPKNKLESVLASGKLVVGTSADYPPYESKDANGNFVGFDMDLIREIGKRLGVEVEIQDLGFDALIAAVEGGKVDVAIAAMGASPERLEKVDFTDAYHQQSNVFLVRKDSTITMQKTDDITAYKVGVQTGSMLDDFVTKQLIDTGKMSADLVSRYDRAEEAILDLVAGRVDIVIGDAAPAKDLVGQYDIKIIFRAQLFETGENIALRKNEPEFKDKLNSILTDLKNEGYIDKLLKQYEID